MGEALRLSRLRDFWLVVSAQAAAFRHKEWSSPGEAPIAQLTGWESGADLGRQRHIRGLSLEQVAVATRIRPGHLRALEAGDLGGLPPDPYRAGYLRTYAAFLGLDGEALVRSLPPGGAAHAGAYPGLLSMAGYSPGPGARLLLTRPLLAGSALLLGSLLFLAYVGHQLDSARSEAVPAPSPAVSVPIASPRAPATTNPTGAGPPPASPGVTGR